MHGVMAVPYVGQPVIVLCIERVLSGQLLVRLSGWSGRVEHYCRKQAEWHLERETATWERGIERERGRKEKSAGLPIY